MSLRRLGYNDGHRWKVQVRNDENRKVSADLGRLVLCAFVRPGEPGEVVRHGLLGSHVNEVGNLEWGTQADNARDLAIHRKMGGQRWSTHPDTKLCREAVREIRQMWWVQGIPCTEIAEQFEITYQHAHAVATGKVWNDVPVHDVKRVPRRVSYHGTSKGWNDGCRCDHCRRWRFLYRRQLVTSRGLSTDGKWPDTASGPGTGIPLSSSRKAAPDHGSAKGYNSGCRCDECGSWRTNYRAGLVDARNEVILL